MNQCTEQFVLALLPPERIASVTWLSRGPGGSIIRREEEQVEPIRFVLRMTFTGG